MPRKKAATSPSTKPDLIEATEAIKHVSKAIRKEYRLRRFPSASGSYSSVESEVDAARAHLRSGLMHLQSAVVAGTSDVPERIALQNAIQELIRTVKLLGELA